ncbi:hypothetical protein B0H14DRAFT_2624400 [Mycena olivaceomarginata]|nr:hypothetical protein B0H14DRAFT_2624400 [Mycena olivaceomarginata]
MREHMKRLQDAGICDLLPDAIRSSHLSGQELWDQDHFERLLEKFIVAMDQPFTLVEELSLGSYFNIVLEIPKEKSVKGKIMKMGDKLEKELTAMFAKNESKFALSLDGWTSSNGYASIAMVLHWVNNSGDLGETPIRPLFLVANLSALCRGMFD